MAELIGNHMVKIGSDFNVNPWSPGITMGHIPSGGPVTTSLDSTGGLHVDEFGCTWDRSGGMPHPVGYPLKEEGSRLDAYVMPDPRHEGRFDQAKKLVERNKGEVFIFGKLGMALFERAWSIRGFEELLVDTALRPEWVEELLDGSSMNGTCPSSTSRWTSARTASTSRTTGGPRRRCSSASRRGGSSSSRALPRATRA